MCNKTSNLLIKHIESILQDRLTLRESLVFRMRYGFPLTADQVSYITGIPGKEVEKIESTGFKAMRRYRQKSPPAPQKEFTQVEKDAAMKRILKICTDYLKQKREK
jgi:DNA-directed RNA polymerase sigma subunit (sigma70/sigma32)